MSRRTEIILAAGLILIGVALRIFFLFHWENLFSIEVESYSKLQIMLQWDQSPLLYPDINFGPLHMVLLQLPWKLTGSLVMANRIVALILGIGLLFVLYGLTRRIFSAPVALGSVAFASLSFLLVKTSIVTLAEGPTAFFTLLGLYLLSIYADKPRESWFCFLGAACSFAAMTAMRFETWLFLPILPLWLWKRKGAGRAILFGFLLAIFPLIHMYICFIKVNDPLSFLHVSAAITAVNSSKVPIAMRTLGFVQSLGFTCTWIVVALVPVSLLLIFLSRKSKGKLIGLLLLVILVMFEYKGIQATLAPELYRYLTIPCALIALVWMVPVAELGQWLWRKNETAISIMTIMIGLTAGVWSMKAMIEDSQSLKPARQAAATIRQMKGDFYDSDRIFIGSEYHPMIVVESGLVWENFRQPELHLPPDAMLESCQKLFDEYQPNAVIIYKNDPFFLDVLKLNPLCPKHLPLFGRNFCQKGHSNDWCWYRSCENPAD